MDNTEKLSKVPIATSTQLLEKDVACPSLIPFEKINFENCTEKEILSVSLVLITQLCREVGSSDTLYLAFDSALSKMKKLGMEETKLHRIFSTFVKIAETARQSNPFVSSGFFG